MPNTQKTMRKVLSACVAQPNTPESDLLPKVQHVVTAQDQGDHGEQPFVSVLVMAADPSDAIDIVAVMPEAEFNALTRIEGSELHQALRSSTSFAQVSDGPTSKPAARSPKP